MEKTINVDFYSVTMSNDEDPSFENVVRSIHETPNDESRNFDIRGVPVRLNDVNDQRRHSGITAEMVRIRMDDLPARASLSGNIAPFDLNDDEGVGEETAFFYHVPHRILVIQRNRSGVSAAQVAYYFACKAAINGYIHIDPILKQDTMVRFDSVEVVRKFEVSVARQQNTAALRYAGAGIGACVDMIEQLGAPHVNITLSMGHSRGSLFKEPVKELVRRVLRISGENPDAVKKLRISGKDENEVDVPMLDLLEDRMTESVLVTQDENRRLTYAARRSAVLHAWSRRKDELMEMFQDENR